MNGPRVVRSRFCIIFCCSLAICLLAVNTFFLFAGNANRRRHQTAASRELQSSNSSDPYEMISPLTAELTSDEIASSTSAPLINSHRIILRYPDNMSTPDGAGAEKSSASSRQYESGGVSESNECVTALAASQWMMWNLVDLFFSSAGPFGFLLLLNLSIIIHISRQRRVPSSKLGSIGSRENSAIINNHRRPERESTSTGAQNVGSFGAARSTRSALAVRDSKAERSVTLMLLVTTFMFLVMRTPIAVGHALQMLLTEEKLFGLISPTICMGVLKIFPA